MEKKNSLGQNQGPQTSISARKPVQYRNWQVQVVQICVGVFKCFFIGSDSFSTFFSQLTSPVCDVCFNLQLDFKNVQVLAKEVAPQKQDIHHICCPWGICKTTHSERFSLTVRFYNRTNPINGLFMAVFKYQYFKPHFCVPYKMWPSHTILVKISETYLTSL